MHWLTSHSGFWSADEHSKELISSFLFLISLGLSGVLSVVAVTVSVPVSSPESQQQCGVFPLLHTLPALVLLDILKVSIGSGIR